MQLNSFIFWKPKPSYSYEMIPGNLIFIPKIIK